MRITSPRREARRPGERRPRPRSSRSRPGWARSHLSALLKAQLRLSVAILLGIAVVVLGLPTLFVLAPATRDILIGPIPLPWLAVGVLIYPVVFVAARIYVHQSERIEQEFSDLMGQQ